jgi:hypothetical protein
MIVGSAGPFIQLLRRDELENVDGHQRSYRLRVDCCDHLPTSPHIEWRKHVPSRRVAGFSGRALRTVVNPAQPGPVDPTSLSAPHSAPRPLADTMA